MVLCPVLVLALVAAVSADHECLCSDKVTTPVFTKPDMQGSTYGSMYQFDCKPTLVSNVDQSWKAIAFKHQLGYINLDQDTHIQTCPGDPSPADALLTTVAQPLTTVTEAPATTTTPPATTLPTTVPPVTSTATDTTTPRPITTTATEATMNPATTPEPANITPTPSSASPLPSTQGNINLCPQRMQNDATRSGAIVSQYKQSCYELFPTELSWQHTETNCKLKDGHLLTINDAQEQAFIHQLLMQHHYVKSAWIGINDQHHEEHFVWTSGQPVTYTNWKSGRLHGRGNQIEDCGIIQADGYWDDLPCGAHLLFDFGQKHAGICEIPLGQHQHSHVGILDLIIGRRSV